MINTINEIKELEADIINKCAKAEYSLEEIQSKLDELDSLRDRYISQLFNKVKNKADTQD